MKTKTWCNKCKIRWIVLYDDGVWDENTKAKYCPNCTAETEKWE